MGQLVHQKEKLILSPRSIKLSNKYIITLKQRKLQGIAKKWTYVKSNIQTKATSMTRRHWAAGERTSKWRGWKNLKVCFHRQLI